MKSRHSIIYIAIILGMFSVAGCSVVSAFTPPETPTLTPPPTQTSIPTITPTATQIPFYVDATVWSGELQVPILIYHRFVGNYKKTDATQMRYADFMDQIQMLYDNGFRLISLEDWMNGTFVLPEGMKPLIITLDDLWFADQLYIEDDGTPSVYSGLGLLWKFSLEHPDFGYYVSVFSNVGDKFYADKHDKDYFIVSENDAWKIKLGETIAWALDHGITAYNHLYQHPLLSVMTNTIDIKSQIEMNDIDTRYFLSLVGRDDLIPKLGNMIALPFGEWPATNAGLEVLKNYQTPEGKPLLGIFEAYNLGEQVFTPSVFSPEFNRYSITRITASSRMIDWIITNKDQIPTATNCRLGPLEESQASDPSVIQAAIQTVITTQTCAEGVYNVNGIVYIAKEGVISLYQANEAGSIPMVSTQEPTLNP